MLLAFEWIAACFRMSDDALDGAEQQRCPAQALACCGSWWLLSQSSGLTTANGAGDPNDLAFQDYCTKSVSFDMRIMELSDAPASSRKCQTAPP